MLKTWDCVFVLSTEFVSLLWQIIYFLPKVFNELAKHYPTSYLLVFFLNLCTEMNDFISFAKRDKKCNILMYTW